MQACRLTWWAVLICLAGDGGATAPPAPVVPSGAPATRLRAGLVLPVASPADGGAGSGSRSVESEADGIGPVRRGRDGARRAEVPGASGAPTVTARRADLTPVAGAGRVHGFAAELSGASAVAEGPERHGPAGQVAGVRRQALLFTPVWLTSLLRSWPAAMRRRARRLRAVVPAAPHVVRSGAGPVP